MQKCSSVVNTAEAAALHYALGSMSVTRPRLSSESLSLIASFFAFTYQSNPNTAILARVFIRLDEKGEPKKGKNGGSSQTAIKVVELQQALPRARIVYCSATAVSHPMNLGFMSRLGLWGYGTEHPMGKSRLH
jgi:hypothetical protein